MDNSLDNTASSILDLSPEFNQRVDPKDTSLNTYQKKAIGKFPTEWKIFFLNDLATIKGRVGWRGYTANDLRSSGPLTLGAENISSSYKLDISKKTHLSIEKYEESPEIKVQKNDILLVQRGNTIGKIAIVNHEIEATINPSMILLKNISLNPYYLYYWLCGDYIQKFIITNTAQTGVPMISQALVKRFLVPFPPLPEQQKIAEILSTIDEAIDKTGAIIVQTETLKQGLMQELLLKQVKEKKWRSVKLGEYIDLLTGYPFKSELFSENPSGIKLVRGDNITTGKLRWGEKTRYWRDITPKLKKYFLSDSDVLIPMDGSLVGKNFVQIIENDLPLLLVQRVARLRTKTGLLPEFLYFLIANSRFSAHVDCVKTVAAIPHISAKDIKEYKIPLPPLFEQQKIASILSSVDEKLEAERKQLKQLKTLKKGLMQDLLTGKVRVEVDANA